MADDAGGWLKERIVDAALALGEETGWEGVRLRVVAERLGVPLADVAAAVRDLDDVADGWFARARAALVAPVDPGFHELPPRDRLEVLLWRWFEALAPHRAVTVQILLAKAWPFHPHHWVPMVFNLSRTILWLRDAAGLDAAPPRREMEEVGLTWLFLATLAVWARDGSPGQENTRHFLHRRLQDADCVMNALWGDAGGRVGGASPP